MTACGFGGKGPPNPRLLPRLAASCRKSRNSQHSSERTDGGQLVDARVGGTYKGCVSASAKPALPAYSQNLSSPSIPSGLTSPGVGELRATSARAERTQRRAAPCSGKAEPGEGASGPCASPLSHTPDGPLAARDHLHELPAVDLSRRLDPIELEPEAPNDAFAFLLSTRGLTDRDVGDAAGCHAGTITNLRRRAVYPRWPLAIRIAAFLCVPPAEIWDPDQCEASPTYVGRLAKRAARSNHPLPLVRLRSLLEREGVSLVELVRMADLPPTTTALLLLPFARMEICVIDALLCQASIVRGELIEARHLGWRAAGRVYVEAW